MFATANSKRVFQTSGILLRFKGKTCTEHIRSSLVIIKIEKLSLTEKFIEQIRLKIPDFEIQVRKDGIYASRQTNNIDNVIYFEKGKATNGELNLSIWVNVNYP